MLRLVLFFAGIAAIVTVAQGLLEPEDRVIRYNEPDHLADPITVLQHRISAGEARLTFEPQHGYLASLLRALRVPVSSQNLVFSKTALQTEKVTPRTPRAIYFNDSVYVGWTPGGEAMDITAVDPRKGPMFYTLDQKDASAPHFTRDMTCLRCHYGPKTLNVPGHLIRSVMTGPDGSPLGEVRQFSIGHGSAFADRWGGWYVSGRLQGDVHLGAAVTEQAFDPAKYLSPGSDIVALMVLAHQVKMDNLITHAKYEALFALDARESPNPAWAKQRVAHAGDALLDYMLFRDEAPLRGPVQGSSSFARDFESRGPRDRQGRSLRDLDLRTRLFRYSCSYMIYSPAFDGLPANMKDYLWERLYTTLNGGAPTTMDRPDRVAVLEILRDTKPEFAAWLRAHEH
ncbi:MAG TPA: hypothetical protein VFA04_00475 [Bryobacteraceae bacterium]|nr:hypothetical protein [Bryobacteraceae bacterium]